MLAKTARQPKRAAWSGPPARHEAENTDGAEGILRASSINCPLHMEASLLRTTKTKRHGDTSAEATVCGPFANREENGLPARACLPEARQPEKPFGGVSKPIDENPRDIPEIP